MSLDTALTNAEAGRLVFPVKVVARSGGKADKIPLVKWGSRASSNTAAVRAMWAEFSGAFTGVVTGRASDLYVVDVDDPAALVAAGLDVSYGRRVDTRRKDGAHYWFASPADYKPVPNSADGGLDIRGDGGYVVCWGKPPAGTLAPLPPDIAEWARARRQELTPVDGQQFTVPEGGRETYIVGLAGAMRRRGAGLNAIMAAITIENVEKCTPPLDPEDLDRIAGSVGRYSPESKASPYDVVIAALRNRPKKTEK